MEQHCTIELFCSYIKLSHIFGISHWRVMSKLLWFEHLKQSSLTYLMWFWEISRMKYTQLYYIKLQSITIAIADMKKKILVKKTFLCVILKSKILQKLRNFLKWELWMRPWHPNFWCSSSLTFWRSDPARKILKLYTNSWILEKLQIMVLSKITEIVPASYPNNCWV